MLCHLSAAKKGDRGKANPAGMPTILVNCSASQFRSAQTCLILQLDSSSPPQHFPSPGVRAQPVCRALWVTFLDIACLCANLFMECRGSEKHAMLGKDN